MELAVDSSDTEIRQRVSWSKTLVFLQKDHPILLQKHCSLWKDRFSCAKHRSLLFLYCFQIFSHSVRLFIKKPNQLTFFFLLLCILEVLRPPNSNGTPPYGDVTAQHEICGQMSTFNDSPSLLF